MRLTRLEIFLLAALLLVGTAQWVWTTRAPGFFDAGRGSSSWRQQEDRTRREIRRAMEEDRAGVERRLRDNPSLRRRFQFALAGLLLIGLGALFQWGRLLLRWLSGAGLDPPLGSPAPPAWGFRQIFRLVLGILLLIQCSALIRMAVLSLFQPAWLDRRVMALADTLMVDLLAALGAGWFLLRRGRWFPETAQDPIRIARCVRAAFRGYLLAVPLFVLLLTGIAILLDRLRVEVPPQPIFTLYLSEERVSVVRILLLLAVVAGPVAEELFFRGLLYGWLRNRIGIGRGLAVSAFLFALLHMDPVAFLPILGLGLLFGWVYERTGSLAAPVAIHIFHNGGMLLVASVIKGLTISP